LRAIAGGGKNARLQFRVSSEDPCFIPRPKERPAMTELCDLSAVELRRLIGAKAISPVELLDSCLARIDHANPKWNAVVALDRESARAQAEAAEQAVMNGDELGRLHGLPVGIKDLNETEGLVTTFGSPLFKDYVPPRDDFLVSRLRAAGGLIFAKTNTPEFGAGANTVNDVYGFTGNALDPDKTASGSSGGSAVALALGMVPLASGSDLGGSLRTPAAYNGVVGFRPGSGLVAEPARPLAWWPLSVDGPMGRDVADMAMMLSVLAAQDPSDPLSCGVQAEDFAALRPDDLSSLRVAVSEDLGFAPIDNDIRRIFRERVAAFSGLFAACEDRDPPLRGSNRVFEVLRAVGFLANFKKLLDQSPDQVGPNVTANTRFGLEMSALDVAEATMEHGRIYRRFLRFMEEFDILIAPTASVPPFEQGILYPDTINGKPLETYISWIGITYGITLTAHPVVVLPCGLDHTGMPFGIQLVGRRGGEAALISAAMSLERELAKIAECRRPLPNLSRTASA
jgi:Asp-tRNA(Asn)/Glu-tRNA(Gln) amidotransferase A subunit family amidase